MINLHKSIDQNMQSIRSDIHKVTEKNYWTEIEQAKLMQSWQRMELRRSTYRRSAYYKNKDLQRRKVYRIYNKERCRVEKTGKRKKKKFIRCILFPLPHSYFPALQLEFFNFFLYPEERKNVVQRPWLAHLPWLAGRIVLSVVMANTQHLQLIAKNNTKNNTCLLPPSPNQIQNLVTIKSSKLTDR